MVIEGKRTAREAAQLVQLSERHVLRLKKGLREQGPAALAHGNRGRCPGHAIADELRKEVIELSTSLYHDYNHTHLQEELEEPEARFSLTEGPSGDTLSAVSTLPMRVLICI
jgi:hypothetical protein